MNFNLFSSKKKKEGIADLLAEFKIFPKLTTCISKAQSLQELNRIEEAQQILVEAERMAINYLNKSPNKKKANMILASFYIETNAVEQAEPVLQNLLNPGNFQLSSDEKNILSGELQKIQRQRPVDKRSVNAPKNFTTIYCCANCSRLHNFVSMPCPHCDWAPQTINEMARSIIISNLHIEVRELLTLSREMANGRAVNNVVPNLLSDVKTYLNVPEQKQDVTQVFSLLKQNEHKNHRSISMIRECSKCGNGIQYSGEKTCEKCGEPVNWPNTIRVLLCMDNLLWLFEQRIEVSSSDAFSDFVCVLVAMLNELLRKQKVPSTRDRQYSLQLLTDIGMLCDLNRGAVIETNNPRDLNIYLIKDNMRDDSEVFGLFLLKELEFFVAKMIEGIKH